MAEKSEYVKRLIAEDLEFPENVILALKGFKAHFKYSALPAGLMARAEAMETMLGVFCEAYGIDPVAFHMVDVAEGGCSRRSCYTPGNRTITMHGKLSVITFLHEFAHALNLEGGEDFARKWSLCLFKKVYPIAFERLQMGSENPNDFVLRAA